MDRKVVVAGAGFAGVTAALRLSRKGFDVTVIDLRAQHEFTPGIIDVFRDRVSEDRLSIDLEYFFSGTDIDFQKEVIEGIDPENDIVYTGSGEHRYDDLVLSLGGEPRTFGMDISDAYTIYSLEDARKIDEELDDLDEVLIVGSGYVGVEMAGELAEKGLDVTVVDRATRPMPGSPEEASHIALNYMNSTDISFRGGNEVVEIERKGVETAEGEFIGADLVIWAGGIQSSKVVQNSFGVDARGLPVNSGLSSEEYRNVFAVGDCSNSENLKTAHNAIKEGYRVAENVSRGEDEELESYDVERNLLVVSMGRTGILLYGDLVLKNRLLRRLKDLVRLKYVIDIKMERLETRVFG